MFGKNQLNKNQEKKNQRKQETKAQQITAQKLKSLRKKGEQTPKRGSVLYEGGVWAGGVARKHGGAFHSPEKSRRAILNVALSLFIFANAESPVKMFVFNAFPCGILSHIFFN